MAQVVRVAAFVGGLAASSFLGATAACGPSWPGPASACERGTCGPVRRATAQGVDPAEAEEGDESRRIEAQPICVAHRSWSAGELGSSVLYRFQRSGTRLRVGYFVYWSTERPWGNNALSYALLPALFTDAFYSHFLFVLPGARWAMYGPGDIEGATVVYEQNSDGSLTPIEGFAEDAMHRPVSLSRGDLTDDSGRVVLMTASWSHQLGTHGAGAFGARSRGGMTCFSGDALRPLTAKIADAFRLGGEDRPRRARAAFLP